jgi:hypothetical protein
MSVISDVCGDYTDAKIDEIVAAWNEYKTMSN